MNFMHTGSSAAKPPGQFFKQYKIVENDYHHGTGHLTNYHQASSLLPGGSGPGLVMDHHGSHLGEPRV